MPKLLQRCKKRRCKRIARIEGLCKSHALKEADGLFSLMIRKEGVCLGLTKFWDGPTFPCAGALQCCHLFSRRYRNIRWDIRNALPGCMAHHRWLDTHPIEKDDMMLEWLELDYEELHYLALQPKGWEGKMGKALREDWRIE